MRSILYPPLHHKTKNKNVILRTFFSGLVLFAIIGLSTVFLIIYVANGTYRYYTQDIPDVGLLVRWDPPETTRITASDGTLLYEPHGQEVRTKISVNSIPKYLKDAFVAIEDKRFWEHRGIDPTRILASAIHDIKNPDDLHGASTITQQLVRNCLLSTEQTIKRKMQEAILSYSLEKNISKIQILELYLNQIPFGSNLYGIETASQRFWGKSAQDLDLAESAILAAIPKATTALSPYENREALIERQHLVLNAMAEQGYITWQESNDAKKKFITFNKPDYPILFPHFTMLALQTAQENLGNDVVKNSGLHIETTLDVQMQELAEKSLQENLSRIKRLGGSNAGLVAIDTKTGKILAMAGLLDFWDHDSGQYNPVLATRQPGSTFKPLVYATAFDLGQLTPDSIILDNYINFNGYSPNNFDYVFHGNVTVRHALANSYNIPAVKTLYEIGMDAFSQKMSQLNINIKKTTGLSAALGAEATPLLNMTAAFASFANNGNFNPPSAIEKITNKNGDVIQDFTQKNIPVFSENAVEMLTSILSDYDARAETFGISRHRLELDGVSVAAKTGTTDGRRDAWTIGYTTDLACGVWVGNNDNSPMGKKAEGISIAAPIWKTFMERATEGMDIEEF